MSYIQNNLMPNEKILFSARVSPAIFLPPLFTLIVPLIFFILGVSVVNQGAVAGSTPEISSATVTLMFGISGLFFFYSILEMLNALIIRATTEFAVTNRRVIAKTGFIRRHTLEMLLPKIESIAVHQNIIDRIFNFGTVTVTGTGGTKESFQSIAEPIDVRKKINQIIEDYQQAYNEYQEQKRSNPQVAGK